MSLPLSGLLTGCVLLVTTASAQTLRWQLPDDCVVMYRHKAKNEGSNSIAGQPPRRWSIPEANQVPPLFFQAELDPGQTHLSQPIYYFGEIPLHLATDLRFTAKAGTRRIRQPRTSYLRPYDIEARYLPMAADGSQRIQATLRPRPPAAGERETGGWLVSGRLEIRRRIGLRTGRVRSFDCDGSYQMDDPPSAQARKRSTRRRESWVLERLEQRREASFDRRVDAAVEKGVTYLHRLLQKPYEKRGSYLGPRPKDRRPKDWFGPGYRALVILTLIKGGLRKTDPLLLAALEDLRRLEITESYSLSVALMAMEAYYAPTDQRVGRSKKPPRRKLSKRDRKIVQEWTDRLLGNHDVNVQKSYLLRFRYHHAQGYDNSVTQYAALGLYSAYLCGIKISPQVWFASAAHWLDQATQRGDKPVRVKVTGPGSYKIPKSRRTVASLRGAIPREWGYYKDYRATSSMTAAGITGLAVSRELLRRLRRGPPKLRRELDDRLRGGLAWLDQRFTMRAVFGDPGSYHSRRYYNWFGIERAFELNQIETIGGRDWYFEGAQILLGLQRRSGAWSRLDNTCFAILFLKRATTGPIVPIVRGPITPGNRR